MRSILRAAACLLALVASVPAAQAQKEAIGMFYELQIAPRVCKWTNVGDPAKLNAQITSQEAELGVTPAEKADFMKKAEAELISDPSNCAADGIVRPMYDQVIK